MDSIKNTDTTNNNTIEDETAEDETAEDEWDEFFEDGEIVFSNSWDTGGPGGGADVDCVFKFGDKYASKSSSYGDIYGPYATLRETVRAAEIDRVTEATVEVSSEEISAEELAAILQIEADPGHRLLLNGEPWQVSEGHKLSRV